MIISGGKLTGKRLANAIAQEINQKGYAEVAAISEASYDRANNALQKVANQLKCIINADPELKEVQIDNKTYKAALLLKVTTKEVSSNG